MHRGLAFTALFAAGANLMLAQCSSREGSAPSPDASVSVPPSAPAGDGGSSSDGPAYEAGAIDPWSAPRGSTLKGVEALEGWEDLHEVPPPINVDGGWTDSVAVTASGRGMLFSYARYDFGRFWDSQGQSWVPTGPARPGMTGDPFTFFRADLAASGWTVALHPAASSDGSLAEGAASLAANEELLVFTRYPASGPRVLLLASRKSTGWTTPETLPFGSACEDDNPFVVGTLADMRIYFDSKRLDGAGSACGPTRHLWVMAYANGTFSPPSKVEGLSADGGATDDTQVFVSPDEKKMLFTSVRDEYGIFAAERGSASGSFGNVRPIIKVTKKPPPYTGLVRLLGEANVAELPQGTLMYLIVALPTAEDAGVATGFKILVATTRKPK